MKINTHSLNGVKIVDLEGDLNVNTSKEFEEKITQLIMGGNSKLVVNLSRLNYISSAGLRVFLIANKLTKKMNGSIRLCCLNAIVKEVFEISGFQMIFSIFDEEKDAVSDF